MIEIDDILTGIIASIFGAIILILVTRILYIFLFNSKFYWTYIIRREEINIKLTVRRDYYNIELGQFNTGDFSKFDRKYTKYNLNQPTIMDNIIEFYSNLIANKIQIQLSKHSDYGILTSETDNNKEQILEKLSQYSSREVEGCMVGLLKMNLLTNEKSNKNWALNRNLSSEERSNSQKEAENY